MKLEKLRLKGFIGIQRGLGLSEIEIDFSNITGLTAFDGMNGAGKSTVLENLHPYNQLASREGALFHHCGLRDSEKELSFTYQGHSYRTLLKIDCQSEKTEGFIWRDGKSEVNGKVSAYAKYIRSLLGSPELFFASVFCAQNSKKLSDLRTGELKELFAEFLRLDRLTAWEVTSKQAGNIIAGKAGQLESRIAGLMETVGKKLQIDEQIEGLFQSLSFIEEDKIKWTDGLAIKKKEIESLRETIAKNSVLQSQRDDLQRNIDRMTKDLAEEKAAVMVEINGLATKSAEIESRIKDTEKPISVQIEPQSEQEVKRYARITEISRLSAAADEILKDREAIILAADEVKQTEKQIEELQPIIDQLQAEVDEKQESEREFKSKLDGYEMIEVEIRNGLIKPESDAELRTLKQKADFLTAKMADLDKKDPACQSTTCVFIRGAIEASEQLPKLQEDIGRRALEIAEINERVALQQKENAQRLDEYRGVVKLVREKLAAGREAFQAKQLVLRGLRQMLPALKAKAAKASEIAVAEQRKADLENELISLREQQAADLAARVERHKERMRQAEAEQAQKLRDLKLQMDETGKQKAQKNANWLSRESTIKAAINDELGKMLDIFIDDEAPARLKALDGEIQSIEKVTLPDFDKKIQAYRDQIAGLKAELTRIEEAEKELDEVRAERDVYLKDVSDLRYIQQACGKNGLQALEIDGAAPLITGYANQLLSQAFGPLYSVRFRTQNDEGKECLEILVIREDGQEVLLEDLSGGERVWVLMALRLAMTLLSKEKGGHQIQTAFSDESDGALDPENALNYVSMYRSFMQVGGFEDFLFISHRPECRNMADHILNFESGKNPYWS